jgi:hypothetical protein
MSPVWVAGIDEAGYGPLLGPLVVALAGFPVPRGSLGADLWVRLEHAVSRTPTRDGRVAVCDSKMLFQRGRGRNALAPLETTALAFLAWRDGSPPESAAELLERLGSTPEPPPLYGDHLLTLKLPIGARIEGIEAAAARLRNAAHAAGVAPPILASRVVTEPEYNRECDRVGSKARVLFDANVDLLTRARRAAGAPLVVCCDRHGGRARYRDLLHAAFPLEPVIPLAEAKHASRYRVGAGEESIELEYRVGGESESLPTALASVFAKYLREVFMTAFRNCFAARATGVAPTAGYWTDGQRFLAELAAAGALSDAERDALVRRR